MVDSHMIDQLGTVHHVPLAAYHHLVYLIQNHSTQKNFHSQCHLIQHCKSLIYEKEIQKLKIIKLETNRLN